MQNKTSFPQRRRLARQVALQALYQWEVNPQSTNDIVPIKNQFKKNRYYFQIDQSETDQSETDQSEFDEVYFTDVLKGVIENIEQINSYIKRYINRALSKVDTIELSITRIVTFELLFKPEIPPKVILNEALELAKLFGGAESHKFVNGVCDKIAREIRHLEFK